MGLAAEAAGTLRSERVRFKPALAADDTSAWTLRDALLVACGCDRRTEPLAYWQWQELHLALQEVRGVIAGHPTIPAGIEVERWANQPSRSLDEVLTVLDAVGTSDDVPVPDKPSLGPWCDPPTIATCRSPYIPLTALVHAWGDPHRRWSEVVAEFDLQPNMTSRELLLRLDPAIRDKTPAADVQSNGWRLRHWMTLQSENTAPVRWLFAVTRTDPETDLHGLQERATAGIALQAKSA